MALSLHYAVRSDLGLVRGNNEDSVYAGPRLLAIADGMGGHAGGEVASKIVIGTLEPLDDDRTPSDLIAALRDTVLEANHRISDAVAQDSQLDGMGTTLTALRFAGSKVCLVHVGDSRAYLLRNDTFTQITHDDTYVQYLVDTGELTPDEAKDHPRRSVIMRVLSGGDVEPDVSIREARAGDRYLLCTDGLSDVVSTETILETLKIADPQETADRLVELALRGGGPDNVTVIVADVVDSRPGDAVDEVPVIAGAFTDPAGADVPGTDSPAERAARISRPHRPRAAEEAEQPRRGRWRTPLIVGVILVLIAAALGGTYAWAQTQYYVGTAGSEVAIYRGVKASFGPLKFSEVYENTDLKVNRLNDSWKSQVQSGITAKSRADAESIVKRLRGELKKHCPPTPTITPLPSPSSSPTPSSTPSSTPRSSAKSAPKSTPKTATRSSASRRPARRASASRHVTGAAGSVPPSSAASSSSAPVVPATPITTPSSSGGGC